jgi:hypothetical protein
MSPAASLTMSPGTSSANGISFSALSRATVAVTRIIAFSFAAAVSARDSWTNRSETPRTTMTTISAPPTKSEAFWAVANEMIARTESRITSGLRHARMKSLRRVNRSSFATTFGPNTSKRRRASTSVRPSARVSNSRSTCSTATEAKRVSVGDTWMPFSCLTAVRRFRGRTDVALSAISISESMWFSY